LYISVGGRNTEGSILRVVSTDAKPTGDKPARSSITRAIEQPQMGSAWARRAARDVKQELGEKAIVRLSSSIFPKATCSEKLGSVAVPTAMAKTPSGSSTIRSA